jgi:outer membrane protein TolC
MVNRPKRTLHCMPPLALVLVLAPRASMALQSLEAFAAGARERNPAALEARASLRQRSAEADVALGRVLPGISFDGTYARNQYSSEIDLGTLGGPNRKIVLLPKNQWNGTATATVPLVDLANFQRIGAARTEAEAAARQLEATRLEVEAQVAQSYYQLVASVALVLDAERARELRTWLSSGDAIHQQWNTVGAGIAKSRAARAGRQAAFQAAAQARSRYAVGNIAQLDLLQAQRDAFTADVNRIQADAELANARAQLRLASGRSLVESTNERNALP